MYLYITWITIQRKHVSVAFRFYYQQVICEKSTTAFVLISNRTPKQIKHEKLIKMRSNKQTPKFVDQDDVDDSLG